MHRVYISAPSNDSLVSEQRKFKAAVVDKLIKVGLEPQMFGERGLPLEMAWTFKRAGDMMSQCQAAVILALVRHRYKVV